MDFLAEMYPSLLAISLGSSIAAAAAPPELVAALMRDAHVNECANSAGKPARAYVPSAFDLRDVTLRTGERMTVAVATDYCLMLGQSTRIFIYERTAGGYRRVLDAVTLPSGAKVSSDGTVMLPTHESMDVIFEASYVWNGTRYAFSGPRSHRYDVALGQRRPYETPVRFAPGTSATTLSGSVAHNFGDDYVFEARAGERLTIELRRHTGRHPFISLYYGSKITSLAELLDTDRWSGKLPKTAAYHLLISGSSESDETRLFTYAMRLTIR